MSQPPVPPRRRTHRITIAAIAAAATLTVALPATVASASPTSNNSPTTKPTIVLVHGAWADASSWTKVTSRLQDDGYTVLAPPNALRGIAGDAAYLAAFLQQRFTGPVVLVRHSYGGAVITNAALSDPDVKALVYVDAFVPNQDETILGLQGGGGDPNAIFDFVQVPGQPPTNPDLYFKTALFPQSSHLAMLSHPDAAADLIVAAAPSIH